MGLIRADLRSLANVVWRREGRRTVVATILVLSMLALLRWSLTTALLEQPELALRLHRSAGSRSLEGLLGDALAPCLMVTGWLGIALLQRQLFEAPELPLWRSAPLRPWRPALQVLLRVLFHCCLWAGALALPAVGAVLTRANAGPSTWALALLALPLCVLPTLCLLGTLQLVLVRWLAGVWLHAALAAMSLLASFGFSAFLLLGLFTGAETQLERMVDAASGPPRTPLAISAVAATLAADLQGGAVARPLVRALLWSLLPFAAFLAASRLHPRAVERHQTCPRPRFLRRRTREWPALAVASIRRKELAQLLQQPGALFSLLLFAVLIWLLADRKALVEDLLLNHNLPPWLRQCGAMLTLWFLAVLMVLYAHMGRIALADGPQWSLYMKSPAAPWTILRGKLQAVGLLLLWPGLIVAVVCAQTFGAEPTAVALFATFALGGTAIALGTVAMIGSWPRLMQPDTGGQITQGSRSLVASLMLIVVFELAIAPGYLAWHMLCLEAIHGDRLVRAALLWIVPAALLWAVLATTVFCWLGARNYRRLLAPR